MHIIQLLLPLFDNKGQSFPDSVMQEIREELVARFGGVTAFSRTPAEGIWSHRGRKIRDEIILVEVMAKTLDRSWWHAFRVELEAKLRQQTIVIRVFAVEQL